MIKTEWTFFCLYSGFISGFILSSSIILAIQFTVVFSPSIKQSSLIQQYTWTKCNGTVLEIALIIVM